jgi:hypothetical protein
VGSGLQNGSPRANAKRSEKALDKASISISNKNPRISLDLFFVHGIVFTNEMADLNKRKINK